MEKEADVSKIDFSSDVKIDQFRLPEEWLTQADKKHKYGRLAAIAEKRYYDKKDEVEMALNDWNAIKRSISLKIRKGDLDIGVEKVTDKAVEDYRESNEDPAIVKAKNYYYEKKKELNEAMEEWKIFESANLSMSHRKTALEKFSELLSFGYYADPRVREQNTQKTVEEESTEYRRGKRNINGKT